MLPMSPRIAASANLFRRPSALMPHNAPPTPLEISANGPSLRRFAPLAAILVLIGFVYAMGWHREVSLETVVRHRSAIESFMHQHYVAALGLFIAIYFLIVAMSLPGALVLSITGGMLFGVFAGAFASVIGATLGATAVFLIARTACGEHLVRRAGPLAQRLAHGFRANAFSYLLFLRLVPLFPFFVVNLVPAISGVRLAPYVAATFIGIIPAALVFAFVGAGLDSVIAAQEAAYRSCLAAGNSGCHLDFDVKTTVTPQLLIALSALALLALVPLIVKRLRGPELPTHSG
jgi:uncharacterized membrane protein YdjX (TVP38/TMEM64 family)